MEMFWGRIVVCRLILLGEEPECNSILEKKRVEISSLLLNCPVYGIVGNCVVEMKQKWITFGFEDSGN